jgi:hypothetical protein
MEPTGTSVVEGASTSKTLSAFHFAWYFFSMAIRVSLFSVYGEREWLAGDATLGRKWRRGGGGGMIVHFRV